jgi:hypothetical protein
MININICIKKLMGRMPKPRKAKAKAKICPTKKAKLLVKKLEAGEDVMDKVKALYEKLVNSDYKKPDVEEAIQILNEAMFKNADYTAKIIPGE